MDLDEILGATKCRNALCHAVFAAFNWIFEICLKFTHLLKVYTKFVSKRLREPTGKKGEFGVIGRPCLRNEIMWL